MAVSRIPDDTPRMSSILVVEGLDKAMDWYRDVLGLKETLRLKTKGGQTVHGELRAGNSVVMLGEQTPSHHAYAPGHFGGSPASMALYVEDCDAALDKATKAGAKVTMPAADMFWGDRMGSIVDPFGHKWSLCHRIEAVPPAEMQRRMEQAMG